MSAVTEIRWSHEDPKAELPPWFEHAPIAMMWCALDGRVHGWNRALEAAFDGKANSGFGLLELIPPSRRAEGTRLLHELAAGKRESFAIEAAGAAGRWNVWRVCGTNGRPDSVVAVTEKEHLDSAPVAPSPQAGKLETVGRLAGGVAHDFNNLLTGVLLYCDLLTANLDSQDRARQYVQEIRNAGVQASGLVRQLMAVARPGTGEARPVSLNEIAEGMRSLLRRLIGENIELQFRLDPNLGLIKIDPAQAQQVLLNLVLNARDAMPAGGEIVVETSNCRVQVLAPTFSAQTESGAPAGSAALLPCALFAVRDNGAGMDASTRARVFEAFFTTKSAGKGTGLGLATVHDIVTSNGGLIHVDSTPGWGTRISMFLPLVPEAARQSRAAAGPQEIEGESSAVKKE